METVEVVIRIPKKCKEFLDNGGKVDWLDAIPIIDAIANGTILPDGHGDLVDRNDLKYEKYNSYAYAIANAPTIIEADKGEVKPNMQEPREKFQPPCSDNCHNYEIGEGGYPICTYDCERTVGGEPCHKYKTRGRDKE